MSAREGAYGADSEIVDFILGITYEIWEERQVELIHRYYAENSVIYGLDGITRGAAAVVSGTRDTQNAFPDRRLMAEDVLWSGDRDSGYYTSHRLMSLMTNEGKTRFGPPTGKRVRTVNIADCVVEDGVIVKEWLLRDNMALVTQLGLDPVTAAGILARTDDPELTAWIESEHERLAALESPAPASSEASPVEDPAAFAWRALAGCWLGDRATFDATHAPYCVLHRSPVLQVSGRDDVYGHYRLLGDALGAARLSVDHVASRAHAQGGIDIAARWSLSATHEGPIQGVAASGKALFILGATHWNCVAGRIARETTVFDELAVLGQALAK